MNSVLFFGLLVFGLLVLVGGFVLFIFLVERPTTPLKLITPAEELQNFSFLQSPTQVSNLENLNDLITGPLNLSSGDQIILENIFDGFNLTTVTTCPGDGNFNNAVTDSRSTQWLVTVITEDPLVITLQSTELSGDNWLRVCTTDCCQLTNNAIAGDDEMNQWRVDQVNNLNIIRLFNLTRGAYLSLCFTGEPLEMPCFIPGGISGSNVRVVNGTPASTLWKILRS